MNYNIGAKYEIIGRILKGTSVIAYVLNDRAENTTVSMEKGVVEELALNKQIYNCTAQVYDKLVNLKGINCKLSKLPRYKDDSNIADDVTKRKIKVDADLKIVGKITNGRTIIEYVISKISSPEIMVRISKEQTLQLALDGRFTNAKVQMNGNELMLRGTKGANLTQLKTYLAN